MNGASRASAWQWDHEHLVLHLHVQPNARHDGYGGLHDNRIKLAIAAPPADGRANRRLLKTLAELFGVPKGAIELVRGGSSRSKTVRIHRPARLPEWITG